MNKNAEYLNDAADYLVLHGFKKGDSQTRAMFIKGDMKVSIYSNMIDVHVWHDTEEDQRSGEYSLLHHFKGTEQLDTFKMMQLFDVMGVVSLKEMKEKARAEISGKEMADELFKMAGMQVRREAARLNYNN